MQPLRSPYLGGCSFCPIFYAHDAPTKKYAYPTVLLYNTRLLLYIRDQGDPRNRGKEVAKIQVVEEVKEVWNGISYTVTKAVIEDKVQVSDRLEFDPLFSW